MKTRAQHEVAPSAGKRAVDHLLYYIIFKQNVPYNVRSNVPTLPVRTLAHYAANHR